MLAFLRRNQVFLTSGLCLVMSTLLLLANRGERRVDPLGRFLLEAMQPLQAAVTMVTTTAVDTWQSYVSLVDVAQENEQLRSVLQSLEGQQHRLRELELENDRLRDLLGVREHRRETVVGARVTSRDASPLFDTMTIDRGESDGVAKGMAVVHDSGAVGRILKTSRHAARVLLVSDHNSGVDALIQRSRARGILEGGVDGECHLKYVRRTDDVAIGDVVLTSGIDNIFPKGVLLGIVASLEKPDHGLFQWARVEPAVDFDRIEEVLVLRTRSSGLSETTPPAEVVAAEREASPAADEEGDGG